MPKLTQLSVEMNALLVSDEREIEFEGKKRGNAAYFLPTLLDNQVRRTDEWASRQYEIYCDCWHDQGHSITAEFVREVSKNGIVPLMHIRKGTIDQQLERKALKTNMPFDQHSINCIQLWHIRMDRLANKWERDLEAEARKIEHNASVLKNLMVMADSKHETSEQLLVCESRLTETNTELEAQKQALANAAETGELAPRIRREIRRLSNYKIQLEKLSGQYKQVFQNKKPRTRPKPTCFNGAVKLVKENPKIKLIDFCRAMDRKAEQHPSSDNYKPPTSWKARSFCEQLTKNANRVSRFLYDVRKSLRINGQA